MDIVDYVLNTPQVSPKVVVKTGDHNSVIHMFEKLHGIHFTWTEDLGFAFASAEDNVIFDLKFGDDWTRPFLHVGQVYEITVLCVKNDNYIIGIIDGKLISHDIDSLKRILSV